MSRPFTTPAPLSLANPGYHLAVEQRFLAMGAAREMVRRQGSLDRQRDIRLVAAICNWENEGGSAQGVCPPAFAGRGKDDLAETPTFLGGNLWVRAIEMCALLTALTLIAMFMLKL